MKISIQPLVYPGVLLISAAFWLLLDFSGVLDGVEEESVRWRYLARGEIEQGAPVVYVDLDAATVSYMGDRPWDRREFGVLLHALVGQGGARVVCLDVILSKFGAGALLDLDRARKGDTFLGEAVGAYADRVVLAAAYTGVTHSTTGELAQLPLKRAGESRYDPEANPFPEAPTFPIIDFEVGRLGLANVDEALSGGAVPYFVPGYVELNSPRYSLHLLDGARRQKMHFMNEPGIVDQGDTLTLTDQDGWTTKTLPKHHSMTLFSLGLETFLAAHGLDERNVEIGPKALSVHSGETLLRTIPLAEQQSIEVNWMEGWSNSADHGRHSMQAVLRQAHALAEAAATGDREGVAMLEKWFQRFEGKVIFVGPVDPQLKDIAPTPFNREPVPKVALHANLYRMIETQNYVTRFGSAATVWIVCLLTVAVALLAISGGAYRLLSLALLGGYVAAAFVAFAQLGWVLPLVAPLGSTVTAALSVMLLKLGSEEWQRRRIKALFGAYVAPNLVDEMVESKQDPKLGGTEAEITALFSDVEGFSALSEELSPDRLVSLMNEYLGAMTSVFQDQSGTLDKYVGDAIITMFGMPVPVADHAARACLSAVGMQERHAALRARWAQSGEWPESVCRMRTRIGLNTGLAVIGNMGSEMRFNYTMMGDAVNLAARCESGAKNYGVYTMVTENTLRAALADGASLHYRKLDRIVVKGRHQPVEVYELWEPSAWGSSAKTCKSLYESALECYYRGQWAEALKGFEKATPHEPAAAYAPTTPSRVLGERCRSFIEDGDPDAWDGAYRMRNK